MHGNQARTSPISMLNGSNNNNTSSVNGNPANYRPQSPFTRTAHPGAVLMSPQSATRSPPPSLQHQQPPQISLSQLISAGNMNISNGNSNDVNNGATNTNNNNNNNNPGSILSYDDMLDRPTYASGGNMPSIQHPIPLSSTSSSPTPVSHMNVFQNNTLNSMNNNNNNNNNNNTFNSVSGQTLLSPRMQSPLLQQYITSSIEQTQPPQQHQQFLDVPSSINILNKTNNNTSILQNNNNNNPTNTPSSGIMQTNGFSQDITRVHHWIQNLSVQQQTIVMDNILSVLGDNVLSYTRSRIDNMLPSSPYPTTMNTSLEDQYNPELLNLDSLLISGNNNNNNNNNNNSNHRVNNKNNINHIHTNTIHNNNTNNNSSMYHPWSPQPVSRKQPVLDMERPKSVDPVMMMMRRNPHQSNSKQMQDNNNLKTHSNNININHINSNNKTTSPITNNSMTPENLTNPLLLRNIPGWLKSLRLHKYSDCLSDLTWQQLVYLNDQELEAKGVTALGARRKLLKAFNIVKDCKENNLIEKSAY